MNNTLKKIGMFEATAFIIITIINYTMLNTPKEIISKTASGAWLNMIFIIALTIIFVIFITKLLKKFPFMDIVDISEFLGGKVFKIIVSTIFVIALFFTLIYNLQNFTNALQVIFLQDSPMIYILLFFLVGIIFANRLGFNAIVRVNLVITGLLLLSVLIIFFAPIKDYTFENLFPILGNGISETFFEGLGNIFVFSGLFYLLLLPPLLEDQKSLPKIGVIAVVISGVYLLLSLLNLLMLFRFIIDSEEIVSLLLSTRIISFGEFFQRVDALFTFLWTFSYLSYLSIGTFFVTYIIKKITNISNQNVLTYGIALLIFSVTLLAQNFLATSKALSPYVNTVTIFALIVVPTIVIVLASMKSRYKSFKNNIT